MYKVVRRNHHGLREAKLEAISIAKTQDRTHAHTNTHKQSNFVGLLDNSCQTGGGRVLTGLVMHAQFHLRVYVCVWFCVHTYTSMASASSITCCHHISTACWAARLPHTVPSCLIQAAKYFPPQKLEEAHCYLVIIVLPCYLHLNGLQ